MNVISPRLSNRTYVRIAPADKFRVHTTLFGRRGESIVMLSGYLYNHEKIRTIVTVPVVSGTYKMKIKGYDNLDNENTGVEVTATLASIPYPPRGLTLTSVGNSVTLSWEAPNGGTLPVTSYKVYGNGGVNGNPINRSSVLATIAGTTLTTTITVANGDWMFAVETLAGGKESLNYWCQRVTLPATAIVPPVPAVDIDDGGVQPNSITSAMNMQLSNISIGKLNIVFLWTFGDRASHFRIYHDSGTGTIDWVTYAYRFARLSGYKQSFTTPQMCFTEDTEYKVGIRAESPDGVVEGNVVEYSVMLDGVAPDEVYNATLEGI